MMNEMIQETMYRGKCSEVEAIYKLVAYSKSMHKYLHYMDNPEADAFTTIIAELPVKYRDSLWELTETHLKLTYSGETYSGIPFKMSIPVQSPLSELKKFDVIVARTLRPVTEIKILGLDE